jgi:hypothetical protein
LVRRDGSHRAATQECPDFLNAERRDAAVQHRMAVGADRPQVLHRIDCVLTAYFGERAEMVDVDVTVGHLAIRLPEAETADRAARPVRLDTLAASLRVPLVGVDRDAADRSLN